MRENVNFAFYVSGRASRLRKFLEKAKSENLENIKLVLSDEPENTDLEKLLKERNIRWVTVNYTELDGDKNLKLSNELLMWLEKYKVDYCSSFGAHILKGDILRVYENRIINFHPSLLPMYPGKRAIDRAVQEERAMLLGNTADLFRKVDALAQAVKKMGTYDTGTLDASFTLWPTEVGYTPFS